MAEQPTAEAVPFEAIIGPTSLPIGGAESNRSEYRTAPQFTPSTLWGDTGTRGRFATIPSHSEDAAVDVGGPPVFRKRRTNNQLVVSCDVDGVQESFGL